MKDRKHPPDHQPCPGTASRRDHGVTPGKRTLTMGLASPRAAGAAPLQRRPVTPPAIPPQSRAKEGPVEDWMAVALRPDLHQAPIMRKSMDEVGYAGGGAVSASRSSSGQAMPAHVQAKMERAFGADFAAVRIHQGSEAQAMGALAYTQGSSIHFAPGHYNPGSQRGQELLGHELAHVVQQSQGRVRATTQAKGVDINDDASLEREADEQGARAARGEAVHGRAASSRAAVQRSAGAASPVQRLKIGNFDTQDKDHRRDIENLLRDCPQDRLREIYRALDQENGLNADYYKQFIQSLWIDRQVRNTPDPLGKVNIVVSIWIDGVPVYETNAWPSGQSNEFDEEFEGMDESPYQKPDNGKESTVSQLDAEPKAFTDAEDALHSLLVIWQHPIRTIELVITGNKGACDGCKKRRQVMEARARSLMSEYPAAQKATLSSREIYLQRKLDVHRNSRKFGVSSWTDYGRNDDRKYTSKTDSRLSRFSDKPLPNHSREPLGLTEHKQDGKLPEFTSYDPKSEDVRLVVRQDYRGALPEEIAEAVRTGDLAFFTSPEQAWNAFRGGELLLEQQFVTVAPTPSGFGLFRIVQDRNVGDMFYMIRVLRGG